MIGVYFFCKRCSKLGKILIYNVRALRLENKLLSCEFIGDGIQFSSYRHSIALGKARSYTAEGFTNYLEHQNFRMSKRHICDTSSLGSYIGHHRSNKNFSSFVQRRSVFQSGMIPDLTRQIHSWSPKLGNESNIFEDRVNDQKKQKQCKYICTQIPNHLNLNLDNSKAILHMFLQQNNIKADYNYSVKGPDHCKIFSAEMSINIEKLNCIVKGSGTASSKASASRSCAFSVVQQLYNLGVIEGLNNKKRERSYTVSVPSELKREIDEVLNIVNQIPNKESTSENQQMPLSNSSIPENLTSMDSDPDGMLPWSPPSVNWHPWTCCEISEPENSLDAISEKLQESFCQRLQESENFNKIIQDREKFPIANQKEEILKTISDNSVTVICGGTGTGKSTQICQFILDDYILNGRGAHCSIIITQPRRIAVTSLSERVAFERCESLGTSVGYQLRFESCTPRPFGSIYFCTFGILMKKLKKGLRGISHVILDEIHERGIQADFLLIVLRDMIRMYPDLRLVLMSATINSTAFSKYFGNCPIINVSENIFPVKRYFLEDCIELTKFMPAVPKKTKDKSIFIDSESGYYFKNKEENLNNVISDEYLPETKIAMSRLSEKKIDFELIKELIVYCKKLGIPGSILIFLPGWQAIFTLLQYLKDQSLFKNFVFLPLHSNLPEEDKEKIFNTYPNDITKVILATNIAETSITLTDVVFVIDSCKIKFKSVSSCHKVNHFYTSWASKSNLNQRSGRAGRVRPGICFHLCSKARYQQLKEQISPEMKRTPLHVLVLLVKFLGLGCARTFFKKALEPPPEKAVIKAEELLRRLKCLDSKNELTPLGSALSKLPLEPKFGKMLILSCIFNCGDTLAFIAGNSASGTSIFNVSPEIDLINKWTVDFAGDRFSDHLASLNAFKTWETSNSSNKKTPNIFSNNLNLEPYSLKEVWNAKNQLIEILKEEMGFPLESMIPQKYSFTGADPKLDVVVALLVMGCDPNVALHLRKNKFVAEDNKLGKISKFSVNWSENDRKFPSPFFVYEEKVIVDYLSFRNMTMVTPIHILLFGTQDVTLKGKQVKLDNWINLDMNPEVASAILTLRSVLDDLLLKAVTNPKWFNEKSPTDEKVINVIQKLCQLNPGEYSK